MAKRYLLSLLLVMIMGYLAACATFVVTGTGQTRSSTDRYPDQDQTINQQINAAFVSDPYIPANDIQVRTHAGVVTLTGRVSSQAIINRAVITAKRIKGVLRVQSKLLLH